MKRKRKEMGFAMGLTGHTFGVRVDGTSSRGLWPPVGGGLCSLALRGQKRFLRWTGPLGRRVLRFDGLAGRGLWWRPSGNAYKVSVTGFAFLYHTL